jgi:hypothetical protein
MTNATRLCSRNMQTIFFSFTTTWMVHLSNARTRGKFNWKYNTRAQNNMFQHRINSYREFDRFVAVHQSVFTPLHSWLFWNTNCEIKHAISNENTSISAVFYKLFVYEMSTRNYDINGYILAECDTYTRTCCFQSIDQKFSSEVIHLFFS